MELGRAAILLAIVVSVGLPIAACSRAALDEPGPIEPTVVRCAVIGGMMETGLWQAVASRFESATHHTVKVVSQGPKSVVVEAFRRGGVDLITVHASDAMIDLVADGLAVDPEPWVRNDLVLVGPDDDPAGVRGGSDALVAVQKIVETNQKLLVHATQGADSVLHDLIEPTSFDISRSAVLFTGDNQHQVLAKAAYLHAYTLVGRIPVLEGKLREPGMAIMLSGDPHLRRPYLVETATHASPAARQLAEFLRSKETQNWLATWSRDKHDGQPLFFPVAPAGP
jgi:tungstate transport system substrate-binding protein